LLDCAEKGVVTKSQMIGIGIGLYASADGGYGATQRLCIKRGPIPDGKGVTYYHKPIKPINHDPLDDDLVVWFIKKIKEKFKWFKPLLFQGIALLKQMAIGFLIVKETAEIHGNPVYLSRSF